MASSFDLRGIQRALSELEKARSKGAKCEDCAALRAQILPILRGLFTYAKFSEAGLDEVRVDHRERGTHEMAGERGVAGDFQRFESGQADLPPSLARLMSKKG